MKNDGFRQIYTLLHQAYLQHDLFEECISLYEKNGWLNDLTATLINKIYEEDQEDAMIGRVLRSAQSVDDLSNLLSSEIAKSGPSEAALLVLDQLALRTKNTPVDGNELYRTTLQWLDKPEEQA